MLSFKTYFVNRIKNDVTMQSYLTDANGNINVYPGGVDLLPENFPCITFDEVGQTLLSVPKGMEIGRLQVGIWSINNRLEVENIHEQIGVLFNFRDSSQDSFTGKLWWMKEDGVREDQIKDRRIWHKIVTLKYWATSTRYS